MLNVERRREDFSGWTKKRRRGVVSRGEWEQPRRWGRRGVSELDRGTDDGEILRRIRREEDGKRKISALCWTGVVGSIAEEKETDTQLTKEFEALARRGKPREWVVRE